MATMFGNLGSRIAPPRFLMFLLLAIVGASLGISWLGWRQGVLAGFDVAALAFLLSCIPLLDNETGKIRESARRNDANRAELLGITFIVTVVVLTAIAAELSRKGQASGWAVTLIIVTLVLAWLFSNMMYTLHYAHLFYAPQEQAEGDRGGLEFPKTKEPDYWDFVYFAFCLGMTFQTSDVDMTDGRMRRVATFHCLGAFIFNLGVIAFTINVLGGG